MVQLQISVYSSYSRYFHCNVIRDFRNKTIILRDLMESSNQKILLGSQSRTTMRVDKPGFIYIFNAKLGLLAAYSAAIFLLGDYFQVFQG